MTKTINTEVVLLFLVGSLLLVAGIYLNFQNLADANAKYHQDPNRLYNNEMVYALVQVIGMMIIFIGLTRNLMRRSDVMADKFVNIMDVFTSLIKKEMEYIGSREQRVRLAEIEEKSKRFKSELRGLKRL